MQNLRPSVKMVWLFSCAVVVFLFFAPSPQVRSADAVRKTLKFDFGSGVAAAGFVRVSPATIYSSERGYGFMQSVEVAQTSGRAARGSLCSEKSFRFSAGVPEGNYNIAITFGDQSTESVTTIKGEARRLMLEKVRTTPGEIVTRNFTINVRSPLLKSGGRVKLKADEQGHFDWDNLLTLEFGDVIRVCERLRLRRSTMPSPCTSQAIPP